MFLCIMLSFSGLQAEGVRDCFTNYIEHKRHKEGLQAQQNHLSTAGDIQVTAEETTSSFAKKRRFEELT